MENNKKVIIGIDFGTSGIGFAYGFLGDKDQKARPGHFEGQDIGSKIPTEIILDNNFENVLAFVVDCASYISSHNPNEYQHFKKIKMNLYKKIYKIKSNNQLKEVDIELIIKLMLIEVKKKAIEQIKKTYPPLIEKNCRFIITVPAIWDYKSKQIMLDASYKAGLFNENDDTGTFFALEPEAASIFYNSDKFSYQDDITTGEPFILCDLGSGTVDIIVQKKVINNNITTFEELHEPVGGNNGSNRINELFMEKVIQEIFGKEACDQIKSQFINYYQEWIKFEEEIELFKKSYKYENQKDNYYAINCDIFDDFCNNKTIKTLVDNFNLKCKRTWLIKIKRKSILEFSYNIIDDLMDEILKEVLEYIRKIRNKMKDNVKTFVFSGGASLSPIMVHKIQKIDEIKLNYVKSHNPEVAISLGSVKFAYDRNIITNRIAKYSFGIGIYEKWDNKYEGKGKKINLNGKIICDNLFSRFITKGESIPYNKIIRKKYLMEQPIVSIELFETNENNVTFTDEKDNENKLKVFKFGVIILDAKDKFDPNNNLVEVEMRFGGTFISISGKYIKTGEKISSVILIEEI